MPSSKADVKQWVEGKIAGKKVVVFSKTYCPYCTKAKNALKQFLKSGDLKEGENYEEIEIENNPDCNMIQDVLNAMTHARSVPRVFINQKCIGGGDETAQLASSGKLKIMLTQ